MGYTCRNYRAAGSGGGVAGGSSGLVLADLYTEDGHMYRTAPVADCGSHSAAISYANQKNNELKAATDMAREIVSAVLSMVTCPTEETHPDGQPATIIGCGQVIEDPTPDHEGLIDCPHCGMWFHPSEATRMKAINGDRRESRVDKCGDNADQGEVGPMGSCGDG